MRNFLRNNMLILVLLNSSNVSNVAKMVLYSIGLILAGTLSWYFLQALRPLPSS